MRNPLLVSLHVPKTAGTSFRQSLKEALGPRGLHLDYGHSEAFARLTELGCPPLELHRRWLDMGYREALRAYRAERPALAAPIVCVHGHFPAVKYLPALAGRRLRFITWLREPLARMVSNYHYWRQLGPAAVNDLLVRRVLEEDWSLEDYCLSPALANYQSLWLARLPRRLIGFIGITEHYEEDLSRLSRRLMAAGLIGGPLTPHRINSGKRADDQPDADSEARRLAALRPAFEALHAKDVALYRWALTRRESDGA